MIFKNSKVYDVLKWICLVCLPAINSLWIALSQIWSLPYGKPIALTISAVTAFLGCLLGISSISYQKYKEKFVERVELDEDEEEIEDITEGEG